MSPSCTCGNIENTEHFLRTKFARGRIHTTLSLPYNITVDLLLYGSKNLTYENNERIFLADQTFIIESKRFLD
jgi:hypothetical protein